jgi:hypothetical protein
MDEQKWEAMSSSEREAWLDECFAYDDQLRSSRHWTGQGEALQSSKTARALRRQDGKLLITDGPFAETKEQLGGFGVIEAEDIDQAVELMSRHPGLRGGVFEIRPIDAETTERCEAEQERPSAPTQGVKFVCLGYFNERRWNALSEAERQAEVEECKAYGQTLIEHGGCPGGGAALQNSVNAKTLRLKQGRVLVTDGPYAETKEQLGGVAICTFRDMQQAVEAWSQHPCLEAGDCLELRAVDDEFNARMSARQAVVTAN